MKFSPRAAGVALEGNTQKYNLPEGQFRNKHQNLYSDHSKNFNEYSLSTENCSKSSNLVILLSESYPQEIRGNADKYS